MSLTSDQDQNVRLLPSHTHRYRYRHIQTDTDTEVVIVNHLKLTQQSVTIRACQAAQPLPEL